MKRSYFYYTKSLNNSRPKLSICNTNVYVFNKNYSDDTFFYDLHKNMKVLDQKILLSFRGNY